MLFPWREAAGWAARRQQQGSTGGGFGSLGLEINIGRGTLFGSAGYLSLSDASFIVSG